MTRTRFGLGILIVAGYPLLLAPAAEAQGGGNPAWFIPGQTAAPKPRTAARPHAVHPAAPATAQPGEFSQQGPDTTQLGGAPPAPVQAQLPPMPAIPDVPRGAMPPAAVVGVLSIPDVLRASTAYQEADKTMEARRQKLNADAQKEQVKLRDLGQAFVNERAKLSAEQIRAKERELQDTITVSRRQFSERGQIIQADSQYALAQIERVLTQVVARVASARGMNLVMQRAQVALNQSEFDITAQVTDVLNKALPTVSIPADGVPPPTAAAPKEGPAIASAKTDPPADAEGKTAPNAGTPEPKH